MSAPVADCPPSASHIPGTIAEKYGPHTPGTNRGSRATAMWQLDVPPMSARRDSSDSGVDRAAVERGAERARARPRARR